MPSSILPKLNTAQYLEAQHCIISRHYSDLYTSAFPPDFLSMIHYLNNLHFPKLDKEAQDNQGSPLQLQEIFDSIKKISKVPGPGGYPIEFYKKFSAQLAPILFEMLNHFLNQSMLPMSVTEASICLIWSQIKIHLTMGRTAQFYF